MRPTITRVLYLALFPARVDTARMLAGEVFEYHVPGLGHPVALAVAIALVAVKLYLTRG